MKMGIFDVFKGKNEKEQTRMIDGYEIGVSSGIVYHCPRGLSKYVLPKEAKSLSNEACLDMSATMESMEVPSGFSEFVGQLVALKNAKKLKEVHFANGIKKINPNLFSENVSFNIPNSVTHLSAGLYIPSEDGKLVIENHISSIDPLFASHDASIRQVEIMGNIRSVPNGAFNQCKNIEKVILHDGIVECGKDAFRGTNKLKIVELPESFNGRFDATMDSRSTQTRRFGKEYFYDSADFEKDENSKLTIRIQRLGKCYTFQIRRGDLSQLEVEGNTISFNNRTVACDISKLNPNNVHSISENKVISIVPQKTAQEQFRENFGKYMNSQKAEISTPRKSPQTLEDLQINSLNLKKANMIIEHILEESGYRLINYIKEGEISDEDAELLTIALQVKYEYYRKACEKTGTHTMVGTTSVPTPNGEIMAKTRKQILDLQDNDVIEGYKNLVLRDKRMNGTYRKRFDDMARQLEEKEK